MVTYIKGVDLINDISKYDYIIVPTNCYCNFGDGFSRKVRRAYPYVYEIEKRTPYGDKDKLGNIVLAEFENEPKFIIAYICFGYNFRPDLVKDYLSYKALDTVLKKINIEFKGCNIATTMIGCNRLDGNGDRRFVERMLKENITDLNLTIYDYEQVKFSEEDLQAFKEECKLKDIDYSLYHASVKKRKEEEKKRKERENFFKNYYIKFYHEDEDNIDING